MIYRSWLSHALDLPVTCVLPNKLVRPELTLYGEAQAPGSVEVRRTYETIFRRMVKAFSGSETRRIVELPLVELGKRTARYQTWPAAHFPPWNRSTQLFFRDVGGRRRERSSALHVTPELHLKLQKPGVQVTLSDPSGTVPVGVALNLGSSREMTLTVEASIDPEVELFVFSPSQAESDLDFGRHVEASLVEAEESLGEDAAKEDVQIPFRAMFERVYGEFVAGSGEIYAELQRRELTVVPNEPQRVSVALHPRREGRMLMALGARDRASGRETLSELLPLEWGERQRPSETVPPGLTRPYRATHEILY